MDKNLALNQKVNDINHLFMQRVCDKHEYIMVTQTTSTTKEGKTEINKSDSWMQCKNCGMTIGLSSQLTGINQTTLTKERCSAYKLLLS